MLLISVCVIISEQKHDSNIRDI